MVNVIMIRIKKVIVLAACAMCHVPCAFGQDLHFSQFMNSPLLTNPANTGFMPDGDYRLGVNYRNQWASITAFPYKTMSVFGDVQTLENSDNTGWMGLGGVILRDVAGTGSLTSTKIYGSIAYHQLVNAGSLISLGFNVGWANKSINAANLTFPSQWNGRFFDVHNTTIAPNYRNGPEICFLKYLCVLGVLCGRSSSSVANLSKRKNARCRQTPGNALG